MVYRKNILQMTKYPHRLGKIFQKQDFSVQRTPGTHFGNKNVFQSFWTKIYKIRGNFARRKIRSFFLHYMVYSDLHPILAHFRKKSWKYRKFMHTKNVPLGAKNIFEKKYEKYMFAIFLYILLPFLITLTLVPSVYSIIPYWFSG